MIPLSEPAFFGNESKYLRECIDSGWVSSSGRYVELFEEKISDITGSNHSIAVASGTAALHISLILSNVNFGDEVIVPSLTFIAPINAVKYVGADPIFMDADDFYNIDINKTIDFIKNETFYKNGFTINKITGKRISAIIPVHVWGNAVEFDELIDICHNHNIIVIEDATEALGTRYIKGKYKGMHAGTIGSFGCLSFNGNKIITCGGGGMILTENKELAMKARYLTTQAKDNPVKYIHNEVGYNYRLNNVQAAIGLAQCEALSKIIKIKNGIHKSYKKEIKNIKGCKIADTPMYSKNNNWINILKLNNDIFSKNIEDLYIEFENNSIQTRPVWYLNHLQVPFKNCQSYHIDKAEDLIKKSLCMPSSVTLTEKDINRIVEILNVL